MDDRVNLLDELRRACASVAERASRVRINDAAIPDYAAAMRPRLGGPESERDLTTRSREERAAFWITLDAINFGSGWFPTLRKRSGHSGYFTVAIGLRERFEQSGLWPAAQLATIAPEEVAAALGQDSDHELMQLFAGSLRDLGRHVMDEHAGSFADVVDSAHGSAVALVERLRTWDCFSDVSVYDDLQIPFLKRAQITAADLHRANVNTFKDVDRLTIFADNLVPHVLRLDGVLEFDPALTQRIDREELIEHGSPEEVEIRACALHAVELLVAARGDLAAAQIDELLWRRGQGARYKARPRHRSRCTAY